MVIDLKTTDLDSLNVGMVASPNPTEFAQFLKDHLQGSKKQGFDQAHVEFMPLGRSTCAIIVSTKARKHHFGVPGVPQKALMDE